MRSAASREPYGVTFVDVQPPLNIRYLDVYCRFVPQLTLWYEDCLYLKESPATTAIEAFRFAGMNLESMSPFC